MKANKNTDSKNADNKNTEILSKQGSVIEELEKKLSEEREILSEARGKYLDTLHDGIPGIDSTEMLIEALVERLGPNIKVTFGKPHVSRSRFSKEMKAEVIAELETSKETDRVIAEKFGVSGPTLYNWKREAGLVKERKTEAETEVKTEAETEAKAEAVVA